MKVRPWSLSRETLNNQRIRGSVSVSVSNHKPFLPMHAKVALVRGHVDGVVGAMTETEPAAAEAAGQSRSGAPLSPASVSRTNREPVPGAPVPTGTGLSPASLHGHRCAGPR